MVKNGHQTPHFLLLQVISPHEHRDEALDNLDELEALVSTYEGEVVGRVVQHRIHPDKATYMGSGKVDELKEIIREKRIDVIVINDIVNAGKLFRLEKVFWEINHRIIVWDRVDLILHIFQKHASSTEAKLQIELAQIKHMGPRIYGLGGTYFSRQAGGIGTRGLGETNVELMKRQLKDRLSKVTTKLATIKKNRQNSIDRRKSRGVFLASLVGYTNSGKTSLFNKLTGRTKTAANVLFTTLDTSTGKLISSHPERQIVVSDTIGFIRNLPPFLIDAFKSTLMETIHADLIVHVVDISDADMHEKIKVVEKILQELSVDPSHVITVYNKIDKLKDDQKENFKKRYDQPHALFVSAKTGEGTGELVERLQLSASIANTERKSVI